MSYRIKTVAEMTGVPRQTLLSWERRYGLPNPERADNGYRVYSDEDVSLIVRVQQLRQQGMSVGEAIRNVRAADEVDEELPTVQAVETLVDQLVGALLDFDRDKAERLDARTTMLSFEQRLDEVYLPTLREIGDRWHAGTATVGQEHFGSYFLRERLVGMLRQVGSGPAAGPVVVCGGYPGEQHEFGLLSVALKLALRGHRVVYLGPDLPTDDLAAVAVDRKAEVAVQSVVNDADPAALQRYATELVSRLPEDCLLAIGGPGVKDSVSPDEEHVLFCGSFEVLQARLLDEDEA